MATEIDKIQELGNAFHEFKKAVTTEKDQVAEYGKALGQQTEKVEKINDAMDRFDRELKEIRLAMQRPNYATQAEEDLAVQRKFAFAKLLRSGGPQTLKPEELKVLEIGNAPQAGYLAPHEFVREIILDEQEVDPLRGLARVMTTSSPAVLIPRRTGLVSGNWVAESGTRAVDSTLSYGQEQIAVHTYVARVDLSRQMLTDSAFDMEAVVRSELALDLAQAEGASFITGSGVNRPQGFINDANVSTVNSLAASTLTASGLINCFYELLDGYAKNAVWVLKRSSLRKIRKLQDGNGVFLWQPGLSGGQPSTILDRPYVESTSMHTANSSDKYTAANNKPVALADWKRFYAIVDSLDMVFTMDPYSAASTGQVRWYAEKRVGGKVIDPNAGKIQKISA